MCIWKCFNPFIFKNNLWWAWKLPMFQLYWCIIEVQHCVRLSCTLCGFETVMCCEVTQHWLAPPSPHTKTISFLHLRSPLLTPFQLYNAVLLVIITALYIRPIEMVNPLIRSLFPLTNISLSHTYFIPGNHPPVSVSWAF